MINENQRVKQLVNGLIQDVNQWRALLGLALKQAGGTIMVNQSTDIEGEFEIVTRIIHKEGEDERKLEIRLLQGKEEIESVLGKPSPIIIPK